MTNSIIRLCLTGIRAMGATKRPSRTPPAQQPFYNGTQQSFMDEYGTYIYLGPMILGGIASVLAAAWKFFGIGQPEISEGPLDTLYALARRILGVNTKAKLSSIKEGIDNILKEQRLKVEESDEDGVDAATLNVVAHGLEYLIHDRRTVLAGRRGVG